MVKVYLVRISFKVNNETTYKKLSGKYKLER